MVGVVVGYYYPIPYSNISYNSYNSYNIGIEGKFL